MVKRVQKRQVLTRARLIRCAFEIMSSKGVSSTSIQEITDAADIGFGTFYNYFASKEDLATAVLDCVIHNLGQRNQLANLDTKDADPILVIANSVRLTAAEMRSNPMWRWWLRRTDLMVRRMKVGFKPYGLEDIRRATQAGKLQVPHGDVETAWSYLIWLLAGTITDIAEGDLPINQESRMAQAILAVMGVEPTVAEEIAQRPLPELPPLEIDFGFCLDQVDKVA